MVKRYRRQFKLLQKGGIVAVKGLGGFHIACDAANDEAVKRLREKKRKSNKPFAVMSLSIEDISQFCIVSREERDLLRSNRRPVVLLAETGRGPSLRSSFTEQPLCRRHASLYASALSLVYLSDHARENLLASLTSRPW